MLLTAICNFSDALAFLNPWCGMTSRDSLSQQVRKPGISVIPVSQMIPLNPARLAHLWVDFWVIGNIITVNFTFWRALVICDHRGLLFIHHQIITIIITSSSQHHYYHQIIIILPSHHHPQLVKITSLITSARKHYISWKVLKPRREKKGVRLWNKVDLQYTLLLHNHKIAWVGRPLWTLCTGGHCVHWALCTFRL